MTRTFNAGQLQSIAHVRSLHRHYIASASAHLSIQKLKLDSYPDDADLKNVIDMEEQRIENSRRLLALGDEAFYDNVVLPASRGRF